MPWFPRPVSPRAALADLRAFMSHTSREQPVVMAELGRIDIAVDDIEPGLDVAQAHQIGTEQQPVGLARPGRQLFSHDDRLLARDAAAMASGLDWSAAPWKTLTQKLSEATGKKGKPLFMPLRRALTGRDSGPEMAPLVERIGQDRTIRRLELAARR